VLNHAHSSSTPLTKERRPPTQRKTEAKAGLKLYLAITFWGEEYRKYFVDFCLPSLLAPGNIPAITDKATARLLIATTHMDWRALQHEPAFAEVRKHITVEHVAFDVPAFSDPHGKMLAMSQGHKLLTRRMFEDRAQGVIVFPDMIAATGFLARLEELWRQGAAAVMFMNVRFANETLIRELEQRELLRRGAPLALSNRELVHLTIRHMHSEMARSGFENQFRDDECASFFWEVGRGNDLLFHCGTWIPLLIDYGRLAAHDDSTFDQWTLDGDYAGRNFSDLKELYVVRDSDDLLLISFTSEAKVHYSLAKIPAYWFPPVRRARKIVAAHRFLYKVLPADWLRTTLFREPVWFRGGGATDAEWRAQERRAARIIQRIERGGSRLDRLLATYVHPLRIVILGLRLPLHARDFALVRVKRISRFIYRLPLHARDFTMVRVRRFRAWRANRRLERSS
jgi:hypothetical protein